MPDDSGGNGGRCCCRRCRQRGVAANGGRMLLLKKKSDDRAGIPALGSVQIGSGRADVAKLVASRHRAVPIVHNNLRLEDSGRTSRLRGRRRWSCQPVFELTVHVFASAGAYFPALQFLLPGPAAGPVFADPGLVGNHWSGDFSASPLDQKDKSNDKQNTGDDSYQSCIVHIQASIGYIGTYAESI